jgi:hypothetical protein
MILRRRSGLIAILAIVLSFVPSYKAASYGADCHGSFVRGSIWGEENRVKVTASAESSDCGAPLSTPIGSKLTTYYTTEIACSRIDKIRLRDYAPQLRVL